MALRPSPWRSAAEDADSSVGGLGDGPSLLCSPSAPASAVTKITALSRANSCWPRALRGKEDLQVHAGAHCLTKTPTSTHSYCLASATGIAGGAACIFVLRKGTFAAKAAICWSSATSAGNSFSRTYACAPPSESSSRLDSLWQAAKNWRAHPPEASVWHSLVWQ